MHRGVFKLPDSGLGPFLNVGIEADVEASTEGQFQTLVAHERFFFFARARAAHTSHVCAGEPFGVAGKYVVFCSSSWTPAMTTASSMMTMD